ETKEANISFKTDNPNIYTNGGIFDDPIDVTLSLSLIGSEIRYTIDNSDPTGDSPLYSTPVNIDSSKTLKAIAIKSGMENSDIAMAQFTIKVAKPYPDIGGGNYKSAKNITLSCSTTGASIKYKLTTIDATTDLTPDTNYTGPININDDAKLIFMGIKAGIEDSDWVYEAYIIDNTLSGPVNDPVFSQDSGIYTPFSLEITSTDSSYIKYTLDGSTPSSNNGLLYEGPIYLDRSKTVKAICYKDGYEYSNVITKTYTIQDTVADPEISISSVIEPESYLYDETNDKYICFSAIIIEIACETSGAIIRWTTNGVDPTENDSVYNGPISIAGASGNITLKAKAFIKDWIPSNVVSQTYSFKLPQPIFNPESKSDLKKPLTVVISQPVIEATTYYTDDGSDPKTSGTKKLYTGPIPVNSTKTIKAYSTLTGWDDSETVSQTYTFN
ncbi:MAG TPA: chitobiase/beta-hexosaminidase C-terminal domain-containing protein, partial [Spirochaetota bacterium]|nr:chitobiase/beta-hexosaminidase C-terminal domain-containing protein [Spirochaetota bacterium]